MLRGRHLSVSRVCVRHSTWTHLLEENLGLCSPKHRLVGEELFCRIYKDILSDFEIILHSLLPHPDAACSISGGILTMEPGAE